jgi:hypothetical protein
LDYVTNREEFRISRDTDLVHVSYFAYFDRDCDETTDIAVFFPIEDYTQGIERFLNEGRCSIDAPTARMQLDKISDESVRLYLSQAGIGCGSRVETVIEVKPERFLNGF